MKMRLTIYAVLAISCIQFSNAEDTVRFAIQNVHFKGVLHSVGYDSIYRGFIIDSMLVKKYGFCTKDLSKQFYCISYNNGTESIYKNGTTYTTTLRSDIFIEACTRSERLIDAARGNNTLSARSYYPDEDQWNIGWNGIGVCKKSGRWQDAQDNLSDWEQKYIIYGLLLFIFFAIVADDTAKLFKAGKHIHIALATSLMITVLLYVIIPHDVLCYQFSFPCIVFFILRIIPVKKKSGKFCLVSLAYLVVILTLLHNNVFRHEKLAIGNQTATIEWRTGTSIFKRAVIRNILKDMRTIGLTDSNGAIHTTLVGHPIDEGTFNAVTGISGWWISYPFHRALKINYRECILFLDKMKELTSLDKFGIPEYGELIQIRLKEEDTDREITEITSSYSESYQAIDDIRFIPCYNHIVCIDPTSEGMMRTIYKSRPIPNASFRLILRDTCNCEKKRFTIIGIKKDYRNKLLQDSIILQRINNVPVETTCYEKFEEFEIESYYKNRTIWYTNDHLTGIADFPKQVRQKARSSDYWYFPVFLSGVTCHE